MSYGGPNEHWQLALNEDASRPFIHQALELGINFFDACDAYSNGRSEEIVVKALKDDAASRHEVVIATWVSFETGPGPKRLAVYQGAVHHGPARLDAVRVHAAA